MKPDVSKKRTYTILAMLLFAFSAGGFYLLFFQKNETISEKDWEGAWKITYFYENEPQLRFTGTLRLTFQDTLSGQLTVFAPRSKRPEQVRLTPISTTKGGIRLNGRITHIQYKIKEGFPTEIFQWQLDEPKRFSGRGRCEAHCAEGTEGFEIIWTGEKNN